MDAGKMEVRSKGHKGRCYRQTTNNDGKQQLSTLNPSVINSEPLNTVELLILAFLLYGIVDAESFGGWGPRLGRNGCFAVGGGGFGRGSGKVQSYQIEFDKRVWAHRTNGGEEHYTLRAYGSAGQVVGSIHVGSEGDAYEGWFGDELRKFGRNKRSGTSIRFEPDKHVQLGCHSSFSM
ncbi:hypothetical protein K435DRAFT_860671 [Dendrothele bispora CBS 962.96]|uniref:Uncharacterized protein n=1 Tax=Dendrothele bispora (strain CBS 962.96) TaxID=1314807 RepID=A0A4S8LXQ6_DENBC|nr:hypothetical protein K435DRAFT_860671 [Dendrothele bispora CBS 962.96]